MTLRSAAVGVLVSLGLLSGCVDEEFNSSPTPVVEDSQAASPLTLGEYHLYVAGPIVSILTNAPAPPREEESLRVQTGMQLYQEGARYGFRLLPHAKTLVQGQKFVDLGFGEAFLESTPANLSPEQVDFLKPYSGFVLAPLHGDYYVSQRPASFNAESWPATEEKPAPSWSLSLVRLSDDALELSMGDAALDAASAATFGTTEKCGSDGDCTTVNRVKKYTDDPNINFALLERAAKDHADLFTPFLRLVLANPR